VRAAVAAQILSEALEGGAAGCETAGHELFFGTTGLASKSGASIGAGAVEATEASWVARGSDSGAKGITGICGLAENNGGGTFMTLPRGDLSAAAALLSG